MDTTISLMRMLGSPLVFQDHQQTLKEEETTALYAHAISNRMGLLYLDTLSKRKLMPPELESIYRKKYSRYLRILDSMAMFSGLLASVNIEHVIFKSIRPYPDESVDIDTIVFDSEEYQKVVRLLPEAGCRLEGDGPQSITFFDPKAEVGIDIYREVAVSCFIYIDKEKLREFSVPLILLNKKTVYTFEPKADLVAIIAHSIMKEQLYTLAEYYTFLGHLKTMSIEELESFVSLVRVNNIEPAVKAFVTLTAGLHRKAHGFVPMKLAFLYNALGVDSTEEKNLVQGMFQTPHKYHALTLFRSLINKLNEEKTRRSITTQVLNMIHPHFTMEVIGGLASHFMRDTY